METEIFKIFTTFKVYIFGAVGLAIMLVLFELAKRFYLWFGLKFWDIIKKRLFGTSKMTNKVRENIKFINDLTVEIRNTLKADRCYIFEFHNGEYFSSRESRWKVSQVYESCSEGISSQGKDFKDIDVSMLWSSFEVYFSHTNDIMPKGIKAFMPPNPYCVGKKKCETPKRMYLFEVEKIENRFHKSLLEREGIEYMLHTPILDENNEVVGIIGVDYTDESALDEIINSTDISACSLCRAADQIAYSWMVLKNTKKGKKK